MADGNDTGFLNSRIVVRAIAALPAAGALIDSALIPCAGFSSLMLYLSYERGAAGGSVSFYMSAVNATAVLTYPQTTLQGAGMVPGTTSSNNIQAVRQLWTSTAAGVERFVYGPVSIPNNVEAIMLSCAEVGVVGTPGAFGAIVEFGYAAEGCIPWSNTAGGGGASVTPFKRPSNFTRPNDVIAYGIGDSVINSVAAPAMNIITGIARINGGGAWINNFILESTNAPVATGSFRLHLYDTTFVPTGDNLPLAPADASRLFEVASIDLDTAETHPDNTIYKPNTPWPKYVVVGAATTSLFWLLEARNAYVPQANEILTLKLQGQQD